MEKRGDWRSVDGFYYSHLEEARQVRDQVVDQHPEARTRIKHYSTLGYSVQHFVLRKGYHEPARRS